MTITDERLAEIKRSLNDPKVPTHRGTAKTLLKALEEARRELAWYADPNTYRDVGVEISEFVIEWSAPIDDDGGARARKALGREG